MGVVKTWSSTVRYTIHLCPVTGVLEVSFQEDNQGFLSLLGSSPDTTSDDLHVPATDGNCNSGSTASGSDTEPSDSDSDLDESELEYVYAQHVYNCRIDIAF